MKVLVWIDLGLAIYFIFQFITSFLKTGKWGYRLWRGYQGLGWRIAYGVIAMVLIFVTISGLYRCYL